MLTNLRSRSSATGSRPSAASTTRPPPCTPRLYSLWLYSLWKVVRGWRVPTILDVVGKGMTPLQLDVAHGRTAEVRARAAAAAQALVSGGGDARAREFSDALAERSKPYRASLLHLAVFSGELSLLKVCTLRARRTLCCTLCARRPRLPLHPPHSPHSPHPPHPLPPPPPLHRRTRCTLRLLCSCCSSCNLRTCPSRRSIASTARR